MTRFIGSFNAARVYTLQFTIIHTHTNVHSHVFTAVARYRLQQRTLPLLCVPKLSPCLSYQLLTATPAVISLTATDRIRATVRLAVYRQTIRLGAKPLEAYVHSFYLVRVRVTLRVFI
jgi:hypothetical protein